MVVSGAAFPGEDGGATRNWPSFRGPLHTGVAPHGDPPTEWNEGKNVRWKVELPGPGHASPIVWGNRVYVLSAVRTGMTVELPKPSPPTDPPSDRRRPPKEKPTEMLRFVVSAIDTETGKEVWQTVVREELPHEPGHQTASQASASPVTDGEHVWAHFGSRGLYCLDRDGKVKWEADLGDMRTRNEFGEGASPAIYDDTIVVTWDHEGESYIVAFDKLTGEERWKIPRDEPTSWSTPLIVSDGDRERVIVSGATRVRAYDLRTGDEIWACGGLGLNSVPTTVADAQSVFVMSGWREAAGLAIRYVGAKGDITDSAAVAWRVDRGLSYVPSPVLYDGKLYFFQRFSGLLSCYDLTTGEACFDQQRVEGLDNIYASPVAAASRIYAVSREGTTVVFHHGAEFGVLATNELDDIFDATPAIAGDTIYLRGHRYLYSLAER